MTKQLNMTQLLIEFNLLISEGYEFPDAVNYCVRRYNCISEDLVAAYDLQFA